FGQRAEGERRRARPDRAFVRYLAPARRARVPLWRLALGALALYVALTLSGSALAELLLATYPEDAAAGPLRRRLLAEFTVVALANIALAWAIMPALLLAEGPRLKDLIGPPGAPLGRSLAVGAAATVAAIPMLIGLDLLLPGGGAVYAYAGPFPGWLGLAIAAFALVPLQAGAEELIFRGYLLQGLAARCRHPAVWAGAPSLAFGALHYDPTLGPELAAAYVISTAIFGLWASWATWRTGSLGVAIGAHVANNWVALLLVGLSDDALSALALWRASDVGALSIIAGTALEAALFTALLETPLVRRRLGTPPLVAARQSSSISQ
ncbi:MAG: CPBP family intramembrane glutamic endopeptidase, partial [Pseudomonadota bacterium]